MIVEPLIPRSANLRLGFTIDELWLTAEHRYEESKG